MGLSTQKMLRFYYPEQKDFFADHLQKLVKVSSRVLDAGCGDGRIFNYDFKDQLEILVGIDLRSDLHENQQVTFACQAAVENLPYARAEFDLIFSRFLIEHIQTPEIVFLEFARVLQPGGHLLILVPNAFHYFSLFGRIIPYRMQKRFSNLVGYRADDTFPTYYRANTHRKLQKLGDIAGLRLLELSFSEPCPWFLSFSPFTFAPAILYERIVNRFSFFSLIRAHILVMYEHPISNSKT